MFLVVPVRHDDLTLRRWPVITTLILLLCAAVWAYTLQVSHRQQNQRLVLTREAATLAANHPDLQLSEALLSHIVEDGEASYRLRSPGELADSSPSPAKRFQEIEATVSELDGSDPVIGMAFGRAPLNTPLRALTSVFAHASWPHIIFNLWFLFAIGLALEDRLGRLFFGLFYLAAGLVAGYVHTLMSPLPSVGASGAISGAIGLTALLNPREKATIAIAGLLPVPAALVFARGFGIPLLRLPPITLGVRLVSAPLLLLGILYVGTEIWIDLAGSGAEDGVAHWAHIGGFAVGALVAAILQLTGLAKRLQTQTESKSYQSQDISSARAMTARGDATGALARYRELLKRPGADQFTIEDDLLNLAPRLGSVDATRVYSEVLRSRAEQLRNPEEAYRRIEAQGGEALVAPALRLRLASEASATNPELALRIWKGLIEAAPASANAVHARLARASLLLERGQKDDEQVLLDDLDSARAQINLAPECLPLLKRLGEFAWPDKGSQSSRPKPR